MRVHGEPMGKEIIMSDYVVKIIPDMPQRRVNELISRQVVALLQYCVQADEVEATQEDKPFFVDCGGNLERIMCPVCGAELDVGWWQTAMDQAYETGFLDLSVTMPCCAHESSLNDLNYHFLCGFACVEFAIRNPVSAPDADCLAAIEHLLGCPVRVIHAHY